MVPPGPAEAVMVQPRTKRAMTRLSPFMVTVVTGFVPETSPLHAAKDQGAVAVAVRVTIVFVS